MRHWILVVAAVTLVAGGLSVLRGLGDRPDPRAERAEELAWEIREVRGQVDACFSVQERLESAFDSATRRTEGLRAQVERFEAMDEDGVPAAQYERYLEVFDEYNASLPEWERRGEALREQADRCRLLVEAHNRRADSLRRLVEDMGVEEAGSAGS